MVRGVYFCRSVCSCTGGERGSEVAPGRGYVIGACQMFVHRSYQVSCQPDTCHCENLSLEQIWHGGEYAVHLLNRNHPEVAEKVGGD